MTLVGHGRWFLPEELWTRHILPHLASRGPMRRLSPAELARLRLTARVFGPWLAHQPLVAGWHSVAPLAEKVYWAGVADARFRSLPYMMTPEKSGHPFALRLLLGAVRRGNGHVSALLARLGTPSLGVRYALVIQQTQKAAAAVAVVTGKTKARVWKRHK